MKSQPKPSNRGLDKNHTNLIDGKEPKEGGQPITRMLLSIKKVRDSREWGCVGRREATQKTTQELPVNEILSLFGVLRLVRAVLKYLPGG